MKESTLEECINMEIVVFIIIVVGCVLCHKLSTSYNDRVKEKYCMGCINWWWSAAIAVLLAATMLTIGEQIFWIFIVLTLCSALLSAWLAYRQMINWGASSKEASLGCLAQVASAIGIAATILLVLLLLFGGSSKKRRR